MRRLTHSQNWFERAEAVVPGAAVGAYSLADEARLLFSHGQGARLWDVDDNEYIDYVGGAGALMLGHAHPALTAAGQHQLARGGHIFGVLNEVAVRLAERLQQDIPCAEKIVYATTGSEATAYALRLARAYTGRELILKFEGAYHGNHDYALVSTFPRENSHYPHGQPDSNGQPNAVVDTVLIAPYNDLAATRHIVEQHRGKIAAIIVEGVQRIIPAQAEFLHGLRRLCDAEQIVFIMDEVVTGFRLGYGGAQQWYEARPDLATYGKIVGAGGPLSCIAGAADILDNANPRHRGQPGFTYLNGTLHGNPVAAAMTLAMLDELQQPDVYERLHALTAELCRESESILQHYRIPARAMHVGSLWQIIFATELPQNHADMLASDQAAARRLDMELLKQGQYVLPGVRRFVSVAHSEQEIEDSLKTLDAACRAFNQQG